MTLYSQCEFQEDSVEVCGSHPRIPESMKQFRVRSVKVPQGIRVTFYREEEYVEEKLTTEVDIPCLDKPFNLALL